MYKCDECKHKDLKAIDFPCNDCECASGENEHFESEEE